MKEGNRRHVSTYLSIVFIVLLVYIVPGHVSSAGYTSKHGILLEVQIKRICEIDRICRLDRLITMSVS